MSGTLRPLDGLRRQGKISFIVMHRPDRLCFVHSMQLFLKVTIMEANRAIEILERQREIAQNLQSVLRFSPEFTKWQRDTEVAIERIFPAGSRNISDFKYIKYSMSVFTNVTPASDFQRAYVRGLEEADAILASMIDEIREYSAGELIEAPVADSLNLVERICLRFHAAAQQIRSRHAERTTIEIEDEYDVQDLLHGFLRLHFDDIRAEEWTPSYAGRSSRVDFLLKNEGIVVEVKKTRQSLSIGKLGEELIVDRARYEAHPDCKTLVCFVYDPEGRIGNPVGLERDLEAHSGDLKVRVIVAPKS